MQNYRLIARPTIFAIAFVCAAVTAALPDATEPMATVRQYVDAFNKSAVEAMAANCAVPTSVLDGLAPTSGRGRQLAGIGTETCWRPVRRKVPQDILSPSVSHGTSMSLVIARMWLFLRP